MRTELFLAWRYLKPGRNAVSLITLTSILGVTLGVTVLMVVLAVMTGFTDLMKEKLVETQAHFQITQPYYSIRNPQPVLEVIKAAGAEGAPVIQGSVLVQHHRHELDPRIIVLAATEADIRKHLNLENAIKNGKFSLDDRQVVISTYMATRWNVNVGDKILLHSANRLTSLVRFKPGGGVELNPNSSAYMPTEFTISGIYSLGKYDFDRSVIFLGSDDAADLYDLPWGSATAIFGWGPDAFKQQLLIKKIRQQLPNYQISTWEENNQQLLGVLAVEKRMMFFLLIFIVLVAAFCIANTLITSVYQKTRTIGLLKAIGATNQTVMKIFLFQGFLIGVFGSCAGTLSGFLVICYRNNIMRWIAQLTGSELFPKEFYYFNELPANIVCEDVFFIVISSVILCTLGAVLPAWRAARLDPAKALRYE